MAKSVSPQEQDWFFERLRGARVDVNMFLINGVRLIGRIDRFDRYTVLLTRGSSSQTVYKHTISTIAVPEGFEISPPEM
ncbi:MULTISPECIES: RNA chaperone Hfq [Microvirga]|uniref:RNA chaperone Hfq n=1 Tax=Microvirga TaxID=186650 RepID=UPI0021C6599E|nr:MULTISPECIES: RNA chaperone Hfq [unclassified Microvirga]